MDQAHWIVDVNEHPFQISSTDLENVSLHLVENDMYHIIIGKESMKVRFVEYDPQQQIVTMMHEHLMYKMHIKGALEQQIAKMGLDKSMEQTIQFIKAPMPGLVLEISVSEGDPVEKGNKILVLEAMKMENVITIPSKAIIKKIMVQKGEAVEKGQVLIELETA